MNVATGTLARADGEPRHEIVVIENGIAKEMRKGRSGWNGATPLARQVDGIPYSTEGGGGGIEVQSDAHRNWLDERKHEAGLGRLMPY